MGKKKESANIDLLKKITNRRTGKHRYILPDGTVHEFTIRAVGLHERFGFEHEVEMNEGLRGEKKVSAAVGVQCYWIAKGVIDPDTNEPLFTLEEAQKFAEGEAAEVQDLIASIMILSGFRSSVDWELLENSSLSASKERLVNQVLEIVEPFIHDADKESWNYQQEMLKAAMDRELGVLTGTLYDLTYHKFKRGDDDPDFQSPSDEQLGES